MTSMVVNAAGLENNNEIEEKIVEQNTDNQQVEEESKIIY
jgi:hypothetical protein